MDWKISWQRPALAAVVLAAGGMVYWISVLQREISLAESRSVHLACLMQKQGKVIDRLVDLNSFLVERQLNGLEESGSRIAQLVDTVVLKNLEMYQALNRRLDLLEERELARMAVATNRGAALVRPSVQGKAPTGKAAPATALRDGIPVSVWNEIRARAIERWPGDYEMQKIQIEMQVEAWKRVYGQ